MRNAIVLCAESPEFKEHIATVNTYIAADSFADGWQALVICSDTEKNRELLSGLKVCNIVLLPVNDAYDLQECTDAIIAAFHGWMPEIILFESSLWGRDAAAFTAFNTGGTACTGAKRWHKADNSLHVEKNVFSNNMTGTFRLSRPPYCLSLERQKPVSSTTEAGAPQIISVMPRPEKRRQSVTASRFVPDPREADLAGAKIVVAVGKGAGSRDGVGELGEIAGRLGAMMGASRAVTMNGWTEQERLLGSSGRMIAPGLCLAAGVSGAAAFGVGIENSETIAAINTDPHAPIFRIADIGIAADCKEVMRELEKLYLRDKEGEATR